MTLEHKGKRLDLNSPVVMGIINVTPDSFYAESRKQSLENIVEQAGKMLREGASILDVGGYSTRPGAEDVAIDVETERVVEAINAIQDVFPEALISVDTFRQVVAEKAVEAGAWMVNDVSGGTLDEGMFPYIAESKVPYCLMHMRGTPATMKSLTNYSDVVKDVYDDLKKRVTWFAERGHPNIIADPGFGFAKTIDQNYILLNNLAYFASLEVPLLVGLSRKSMVYKTLGIEPSDALNGTTVLHTLAIEQGASILRVHDVKEAVECIKLMNKLKRAIAV